MGADPRTVPHSVWLEWEAKLQLKFIRLIRLNHNLIDLVWLHRPKESTDAIKVHSMQFAGEKWQTKIEKLRKHLIEEKCDAMIVTSLTEIAYLLNLRGNDLPYTPVFKVSQRLIFSFQKERKKRSTKNLTTFVTNELCSFFSGVSFSVSSRHIFVCES